MTNKIKIQIKKLHPNAIIPKYQSDGASGCDVHALLESPLTIAPQQTVLIPTGLSVAIPYGFEIQGRPRSGLSLKTPLRISNAPGTIDSDYRGQLMVIVTNTSIDSSQIVNPGDRICQLVVCPVFQAIFEEVETLDDTKRGAGGFGSTGT